MAALKLFVNGLKLAFIERGISSENLRRYYAASIFFLDMLQYFLLVFLGYFFRSQYFRELY